MEKISFSFLGGIADDHELNFYEAGRFQYGAARFIYTLEKFRQNGKILARLTSKIDADIRIKAPKKGSFLQDILVVAVPAMEETFVHTSFEALFAYAWDKLLPKSKGTDIAVELAKIEHQREEERTKQEVERTRQTELMAQVALSSHANTMQAIEVIGKLVDKYGNDGGIGGYSAAELDGYRNELKGQLSREQLLVQHQAEFSKITPEQERKLSGQLRKTVSDIALPLRSSASSINISAPTIGVVANLDGATVKNIVDVDEDEIPKIIRGHIKAYDVESGSGKFRYDEQPNPLSFRVPAAIREELREEILDSMKREDVLISFYFIRDRYGNPTALILDQILEDEDYDKVHR